MTTFFLIVFVAITCLCFAYWKWRQKIEQEITEGASFEWAHLQKHEPEFVKGFSEEEFKQVYGRVHAPRFPGYALAILISFAATLPITFILLTATLWGADAIGMTPEPVELADRLLLEDDRLIFFKETPPEAALYYIRDLGGFYYFFGVITVWLGIVAFFMRRYHSRRPGYLRDEIIRARH